MQSRAALRRLNVGRRESLATDRKAANEIMRMLDLASWADDLPATEALAGASNSADQQQVSIDE